jgi:DNA-binding MarR family transcriptional regulator
MATMATDTPFTAQVLGETEKALNAILYRQLDVVGLTEPEWITLQLTRGAGGDIARQQLVTRLAGALKVGDADAEGRVTGLEAAGLLSASEDGQVAMTEAGAHVHARVRGEVGEITRRLWGDLPAEDLATTGRTLATILERANAHFGAPDQA